MNEFSHVFVFLDQISKKSILFDFKQQELVRMNPFNRINKKIEKQKTSYKKTNREQEEELPEERCIEENTIILEEPEEHGVLKKGISIGGDKNELSDAIVRTKEKVCQAKIRRIKTRKVEKQKIVECEEKLKKIQQLTEDLEKEKKKIEALKRKAAKENPERGKRTKR